MPPIRWCLLLLSLLLGSAGWPARAQQEPPAPTFEVREFVVEGDNPLTTEETNAALQPFLGSHEGLAGLLAATDALEQAMQAKGFSFHRVVLPPQTLKQGVVRFEIVEFVVGAVEVDGQTHFDADNIQNSLAYLEPGLTPNTRLLSRSIALANLHPSKKVRLLFRDSEQEGAINARIEVRDQPPGYFFAALNNTGNEQTGDYRLTLGYQYSNLFNRDHGITASYTTSPSDVDKVTQVGLSYRAPFYRLGSALNVLFSTSDVSNGEVPQAGGGDPFQISGQGQVLGLRYEQLFLRRGEYSHSLSLGADFKRFYDNTVELGGSTLSSTPDVGSSPLVADYGGQWLRPGLGLEFGLGLSHNLETGPNNSEEDYAPFGAELGWSAWRYSLGLSWFVGGGEWMMRARLRGQSSSDVLIPGERFGVGGFSTVRGLDERALTGDSGYVVNLEAWSPPLVSQQLRLLAFYDLGQVENQSASSPVVASNDNQVIADAEVASVGAGLRWTWREDLSVQADAAIVTRGAGVVETDDSKVHLGLFYRF